MTERYCDCGAEDKEAAIQMLLDVLFEAVGECDCDGNLAYSADPNSVYGQAIRWLIARGYLGNESKDGVAKGVEHLHREKIV